MMISGRRAEQFRRGPLREREADVGIHPRKGEIGEYTQRNEERNSARRSIGKLAERRVVIGRSEVILHAENVTPIEGVR